MTLTISQITVWQATMVDEPGGLAAKLLPMAEAGTSFEFVQARRSEATPGKAVVYVAPLKGARQLRAAEEAGFTKARNLTALRLEATDQPGLGARVTGALTKAHINLENFSAMAIGKRAVIYLTFEKDREAGNARQVLKSL